VINISDGEKKMPLLEISHIPQKSLWEIQI
jgi:hypothetical protein